MRLIRHDERDRDHPTDTDASATSAEEPLIATDRATGAADDGRSWHSEIDERRGAANSGVERAAAAAVTAAAYHCHCHADRCHVDSCCHAAA